MSAITTDGLAVDLGEQTLTARLAVGFYPEFSQRAMLAAVAVAWAVHDEDPARAGHAARMSLARSVLLDPARFERAFAMNVVAAGQVSAGFSDAELVGRIAAAWSPMAGADQV